MSSAKIKPVPAEYPAHQTKEDCNPGRFLPLLESDQVVWTRSRQSATGESLWRCVAHVLLGLMVCSLGVKRNYKECSPEPLWFVPPPKRSDWSISMIARSFFLSRSRSRVASGPKGGGTRWQPIMTLSHLTVSCDSARLTAWARIVVANSGAGPAKPPPPAQSVTVYDTPGTSLVRASAC